MGMLEIGENGCFKKIRVDIIQDNPTHGTHPRDKGICELLLPAYCLCECTLNSDEDMRVSVAGNTTTIFLQ